LGSRILLVENDPSLRNLLALFFRNILGADVFIAADGFNGILEYENTPHEWNLVITDYKMPGLTGIELVSHIRDKDPQIPVVVFSGMNPEMVIPGYSAFENCHYVAKEIGSRWLSKLWQIVNQIASLAS
jgi:CheY-like chemotaxis protein